MYQIQIRSAAARQLKKLTTKTRKTLGFAIDELAVNPRPPGIEKLAGKRGLYRIRRGDHRVVYEIDDGLMMVTIVTIGHRRDVYRQFRL